MQVVLDPTIVAAVDARGGRRIAFDTSPRQVRGCVGAAGDPGTRYETVLRRVASAGANASNALFLMTWFKGSIDLENIHPLEGGFLRLKYRRDRRPGQSVEPMWWFYSRYYSEMAIKLARWCALYLRLRRIYLRIKRDPRRTGYMDLAMTSITDQEVTREIFQTKAARAYLGQQRRLADARQGAVA